jgi:hypothetical protein
MATLRDGNLVVDEGETLTFPVEAQHPIAECQQLVRITSLADVRDFAFAQRWAYAMELPGEERGTPGTADQPGRVSDEELRALRESPRTYPGPVVSATQLLQYVREISGGAFLQLQVADFIVPANSSVVLNQAMNHITANRVVLQGQLQVSGDLVIRCAEIRGA